LQVEGCRFQVVASGANSLMRCAFQHTAWKILAKLNDSDGLQCRAQSDFQNCFIAVLYAFLR